MTHWGEDYRREMAKAEERRRQDQMERERAYGNVVETYQGIASFIPMPPPSKPRITAEEGKKNKDLLLLLT